MSIRSELNSVMSRTVVDDVQMESHCRFLDIDQEHQKMFLPIEGYENQPLVSLECAVEPLVDLLPGIHRKVYIAKHNSQSPADQLTCDESAAICLYSMEWIPHDKCLYFVLNATLRDKNRDQLKPWFLYLRLLLNALTRLPSERMTIYRGIKLDLVKDYPRGKIFVWWGFSSCTSSIEVLQSNMFLGKTGTRTMFAIECKNGKDIRRHSYYGKEHEVLLSAATSFQVVGTLDQGYGFHIIQIKEVDPPFPLIQPVIIPTSPKFTWVYEKKFDLPLSPTMEPASLPYRNLPLEKRIAQYQPGSWIYLEKLELTDRDIPVIIEQALIDHQCTLLDLQQNQITAEGIAILSTALTNNETLETLTLNSNPLTNQAVRFLAQSLLQNQCRLKILSLASTNLTDECLSSLHELLKSNRTLLKLNLSSNRLTDRTIQSLAKVLTRFNQSLEELDLHSNRSITDVSIDNLIEMFQHNWSLKSLFLFDCKMTDRGKTRLREAGKQKKNFLLRVNSLSC